MVLSFLWIATAALPAQPTTDPPRPDLQWTASTPWPIHSLTAAAGVALAGSDHSTYLYALSVDSGQILWQRNLGGGIWNDPTVVNTTVLLIPFGSALTSLRLETGDINWQRTPGFPESSNPFEPFLAPALYHASPFIHKRQVLSLTMDGVITKLNLEGETVDRLELGPLRARDQFWARPVVSEDHLFLGSTRGSLWHVDLNELRRVSRDALQPPEGNSPFPSGREIRADLLALNQRIFVGTLDGSLYCRPVPELDEPGWQRYLGSGTPQVTARGVALGGPTAPAGTRGDRIFVATLQSLHCLQATTGTPVWNRKVSTGLASPPAFWRELVVVTTTAGRLNFYQQKDGAPAGQLDLRATPTAGPTIWQDQVLLGYADGVIEGYRLTTTSQAKPPKSESRENN